MTGVQVFHVRRADGSVVPHGTAFASDHTRGYGKLEKGRGGLLRGAGRSCAVEARDRQDSGARAKGHAAPTGASTVSSAQMQQSVAKEVTGGDIDNEARRQARGAACTSRGEEPCLTNTTSPDNPGRQR